MSSTATIGGGDPAPLNICALATEKVAEIGDPADPPFKSQARRSLKTTRPCGCDTADWIVFSWVEFKVPWKALSGCTGSVTLKLKNAPGCDALSWFGAETGPMSTRRCWWNTGTVGLPADGAPSDAVA